MSGGDKNGGGQWTQVDTHNSLARASVLAIESSVAARTPTRAGAAIATCDIIRIPHPPIALVRAEALATMLPLARVAAPRAPRAPRLLQAHAAASAARRLSSSSSPPPPPPPPSSESERVHGALDASQVRSKAMRARLERQARQQAPPAALLRQEPPPEDDGAGAGAGAGAGGGAPSFGAMLWQNVVAGFGMAIAFTVVGVAWRAMFGGSGGGAAHAPRPPAPAARPPPQLAPMPEEEEEEGSGGFVGGGFARDDEGDADPYASRTQQGVAPGAGRPRGVAL